MGKADLDQSKVSRETRLVAAVVGLTVVLAGLAIGTAIRINADRTRIAEAKEKSDQRLKLYKETVSRFVNRSPQLLEGVPLASGARDELVALTDQLLQESKQVDDDDLGPSQQWAKQAIFLRRGDLYLGKYTPMIGQSEEGQVLLSKAEGDFQQSLMIAKAVYNSLEGDRAKAAGNYAYAIERIASVYRLQGRIEDAMSLFQKAISLREEALLVARTEDSLNYRLASLGREQANYADFLVSLGPNSDSQELELMVSSAIRNLEKAGDALVETDALLSPVLRDLGIAYSVAAKYFESLGKDDETREFYVKAIDVNRKLVEQNRDRVGFKNNLIRTSYDYGDYLLVHAASAEEARDVYVPAILSVREMLADPSLEELEQEGLAMGYYRLGLVSIVMGNREKAVRYFGRCALIRDLRYREFQDTAEYRADPDVALTMYIELLLPLAIRANSRSDFWCS